MSAYRTALLDEIAPEKAPEWSPIRHHFGIETFGVNAFRGGAGDDVIEEHDESDSGAQELYWVVSGGARFRVGGDEVDAPAGTLLWVPEAGARRSGVATAAGTLVLAIGGAAPGVAYTPGGWDTRWLEKQ